MKSKLTIIQKLKNFKKYHQFQEIIIVNFPLNYRNM